MQSFGLSSLLSGRWVSILAVMVAVLPEVAGADSFEAYRLGGSFQLPAGASAFDVMPDGRIVTLVGANLYAETAPHSHTFQSLGLLPGADIPSFGAAFLRISADGTMLAIGNNGGANFNNYRVGIFTVSGLTGNWFAASHYDAVWISATQLAISGGDFGDPIITILDVTSPNPNSPDNRIIIDNIGDASGGIAFDGAGRLFTGNGFQSGGPVGTGVIKSFTQAAWMTAYTSGIPINFQASGVNIIDILSASPLGFDRHGNILIGGGDFNTAGQFDYVALVKASAVQSAAAGNGPVNIEDISVVRRLDPDAASGGNFYTFAIDSGGDAFYIRDLGNSVVFAYFDATSIPAVGEWGLVMLSLAVLIAGSIALRSHRLVKCP